MKRSLGSGPFWLSSRVPFGFAVAVGVATAVALLGQRSAQAEDSLPELGSGRRPAADSRLVDGDTSELEKVIAEQDLKAPPKPAAPKAAPAKPIADAEELEALETLPASSPNPASSVARKDAADLEDLSALERTAPSAADSARTLR